MRPLSTSFARPGTCPPAPPSSGATATVARSSLAQPSGPALSVSVHESSSRFSSTAPCCAAQSIEATNDLLVDLLGHDVRRLGRPDVGRRGVLQGIPPAAARCCARSGGRPPRRRARASTQHGDHAADRSHRAPAPTSRGHGSSSPAGGVAIGSPVLSVTGVRGGSPRPSIVSVSERAVADRAARWRTVAHDALRVRRRRGQVHDEVHVLDGLPPAAGDEVPVELRLGALGAGLEHAVDAVPDHVRVLRRARS